MTYHYVGMLGAAAAAPDPRAAVLEVLRAFPAAVKAVTEDIVAKTPWLSRSAAREWATNLQMYSQTVAQKVEPLVATKPQTASKLMTDAANFVNAEAKSYTDDQNRLLSIGSNLNQAAALVVSTATSAAAEGAAAAAKQIAADMERAAKEGSSALFWRVAGLGLIASIGYVIVRRWV